jgi:hypothetical protein
MSSHLGELVSSPFRRAPVAERLVRPLRVVPVEPSRDLTPGLREVPEDALPDALLLEAPEEALDNPVLRGSVGRDELLTEAVVRTGRPEAPTLVEQAVVRADHRGRAGGPEGTEPSQAGLLESTFGLLSASLAGELPADALPIVAPLMYAGPLGGAAVDYDRVST